MQGFFGVHMYMYVIFLWYTYPPGNYLAASQSQGRLEDDFPGDYFGSLIALGLFRSRIPGFND